ncbi:taspase, threonine aspartase, 1 [Coemansia sp. RSA 1836]|nr:taspase, threonine aspartase, 1 [Coemansia sp. RSA 1836]
MSGPSTATTVADGSSFYIAVHVGAGYHSKSKERTYKAAMKKACRAAAEKLRLGGSASDAVESAIRVLEDSPATNAGIGSNLNRLGLVECDASIMSSQPDGFGAVGASTGMPFLVLPSSSATTKDAFANV